jgi:cytochrome c peroxidase
MRHRKDFLRGFVLLALAIGACEPAGRYAPKPARTTPNLVTPSSSKTPLPSKPESAKTATPTAAPVNYAWELPRVNRTEPETRIEFVHEGSDPKEWARLQQFWTVLPSSLPPSRPVGLVGLSPLHAVALVLTTQTGKVVKIKVPLGLDDPTPHIPLANPPTLEKWELGKQLFFDDSFLVPASAGKIACASCHDPTRNFTNLFPRRFETGNLNTPSLVNVVFNTYQFWDGRANALEEVVSRTPDDDRAVSPPDMTGSRHDWTGVVKRLRENKAYQEHFQKVFGTDPTQDAVGKALATYQRTILSGNAVQDQAQQACKARGGKVIEAKDYEKVLDDANVKFFEYEPAQKGELAKNLEAGYSFFWGQARCIACHGGANFTDNGFHNIGIGDSGREPVPGKETGRFAALPIGLKDVRMIGAYKTPSLRALVRSKISYYYHDGSRGELPFVVSDHIRDVRFNPHLDAEIRDGNDPSKVRDLGLDGRAVESLVLFLKALNGASIDPVVAERKK